MLMTGSLRPGADFVCREFRFYTEAKLSMVAACCSAMFRFFYFRYILRESPQAGLID